MKIIQNFIASTVVFLLSGSSLETAIANANTAPAPGASVAIGIKLDRIEKGEIYFKRADTEAPIAPLVTQLKGVEYLGPLYPRTGGLPYVLLSALECETCTQKFLYLFRAGGKASQEPLRLIYPGRVTEKQSGSTVYEGRAFFGKCLPNKDEAFVVFQNEKLKRRKYFQSSVFYAEVQDNRVEEHVVIRRHPKLATILNQVKRKQCIEIKGQDRNTQKFKWPDKPNLEIEKPDEAETIQEKTPTGNEVNSKS